MEKEITPILERTESEYVDAVNGVEPEQREEQRRGFGIELKNLNMDVNLGINLSIGLILLIFSGLLFLPSKMLLHTSYEVQNESEARGEEASSRMGLGFPNSAQLRRRRLCPGLHYKHWMLSSFHSNYDRNCTYSPRQTKKKIAPRGGNPFRPRESGLCLTAEKKEPIMTYNYNGTIEEMRGARPKYAPITGHILAMMLVVSAVVAFVEVLRIRFINPKDSSAVETAGSRKGSTVDVMGEWRVPPPRAPIRSQRSFELQGMRRSALRLLGPRPPPLIRRSSFPTYLAEPTDLHAPTFGDTSTLRSIVRRPSVSFDGADSAQSTSAHRHTRLIRRH